MPLLQQSLSSGIADAFRNGMKITEGSAGCPPNIVSSVAKELAGAYHSYASKIMAGPLTPISFPMLSILETSLEPHRMIGWGTGLMSYWTPVMWKGPGFIPANPTIPGIISAAGPEVFSLFSNTIPSLEECADRIASILHKYTMQLKVLATTTTVPPVVSILPVS